MKISDLQLLHKKNNYVYDLLSKSIIPTNYMISRYINDEFTNLNLGIPAFRPFEIKKYSTSNKTMWNKNFKNLDMDLQILYQSFNSTNNEAIACEELYLSEKEVLTNKLNVINLMIDNIKDNLKAKNDLYSYAQIFNSFYTCELYEDTDRNIPETTSFINLLQKNVKNNEIMSLNSKINLSSATINIDSNRSTPIVENGKIENILTDTINEFYYVEYSTVVADTDFVTTLTVNLPYPKKMSSITLECSSPSMFNATLKLSSDGTGYKNLYTVSNYEDVSWMFEAQYVSSFTISLEKPVADGSEEYDSYYYYTFKNVSCFNTEYEESSTYVSNRIEMGSIINDLTLNVSEVILPKTSIDYFIGLDNDKDPIEWKQFFNGKESSLNIFNNRNKILNNALNEYGGYIDNGCYTLYNLPKGYSTNDMMLYSGYQMWKLQTLDIPDEYKLTEYEPDIVDYTDYYIKRRGLVDTEEYEFSIRNAKTHIFSQYIYCDKSYFVRDIEVICKYTSGIGLKHKLYVNNSDVVCMDNKYGFTLKKGLNSIHLMLYVQAENSEGFTDIRHNINFKEFTYNIFSSKPMKFINANKLLSNSIVSSDRFYSILKDTIIVKDGMDSINENIIFKNLRSDINYKNNSRYLLKFKQLNKLKEHLVDVDNNKTYLRVMANLKSNEASYSPQINNFRLNGR